jgi:hypothetical protein
MEKVEKSARGGRAVPAARKISDNTLLTRGHSHYIDGHERI